MQTIRSVKKSKVKSAPRPSPLGRSGRKQVPLRRATSRASARTSQPTSIDDYSSIE